MNQDGNLNTETEKPKNMMVIVDDPIPAKEEPKFSPIQIEFHKFLKARGEDPLNPERFADHKVMFSIYVEGAIAQHALTMPMILQYFLGRTDTRYIKWVIQKTSSIFGT